MFCEQCGKEIPDNSKFCPACGTKVEAAAAVPAPEPQQAPASEVQPAPAPAPAPAPQATQAPPPPPPQPVAPATVYNNQYNSRDNLVKPLSIGSYIGIFIVMAIPLVNLIMLLVWSFSDSVNLNKKHFAIAGLIMIVISIVLAVGLSILLASMGYGIMNWYYNFM